MNRITMAMAGLLLTFQATCERSVAQGATPAQQALDGAAAGKVRRAFEPDAHGKVRKAFEPDAHGKVRKAFEPDAQNADSPRGRVLIDTP